MITRQESGEEEDEEVLAYEKEVLVCISKILETLLGQREYLLKIKTSG